MLQGYKGYFKQRDCFVWHSSSLRAQLINSLLLIFESLKVQCVRFGGIRQNMGGMEHDIHKYVSLVNNTVKIRIVLLRARNLPHH